MAKLISLRKRLTWYLIAVMLSMAGFSGFFIYTSTLQEADEIFSASLVQSARILDGLISPDSIDSNRLQLQRALESGPRQHEYERKLFFSIIDSSGTYLLKSKGAPEIPDHSFETGFAEFYIDQVNWFTYTHRSHSSDWLIVVGERGEIRQEITEYIGSGTLIPLILLLPVVVWLLWVIVGIVLKPLKNVSQEVSQRNLNNLSEITTTNIPAEILPLVESFNRMLAGLEQAYRREQRFVGDASHELRNPLASLLVNVDNAIEECDSQPDALESLNSMKTSIKRLSLLVSQLLQLSRFENPANEYEFVTVDINDLLLRVIGQQRAQAQVNHQTIDIQASCSGCCFSVVEQLFESMLINIIDNAIKHSGEGSLIRVSCEQQSGCTLILVDDSGKGMAPATRERAGDRFYRAGDTNVPGSGLGLAIARSIAEIHSGTLEIADSELGGLQVTIRLRS